MLHLSFTNECPSQSISERAKEIWNVPTYTKISMNHEDLEAQFSYFYNLKPGTLYLKYRNQSTRSVMDLWGQGWILWHFWFWNSSGEYFYSDGVQTLCLKSILILLWFYAISIILYIFSSPSPDYKKYFSCCVYTVMRLHWILAALGKFWNKHIIPVTGRLFLIGLN